LVFSVLNPGYAVRNSSNRASSGRDQFAGFTMQYEQPSWPGVETRFCTDPIPIMAKLSRTRSMTAVMGAGVFTEQTDWEAIRSMTFSFLKSPSSERLVPASIPKFLASGACPYAGG
jgi:hypothetical protein